MLSGEWSVAVQGRTVGLQPYLGARCFGTMAEHKTPEFSGMIHVTQMGDFVGGHIIQHVVWSHDKAP